MKWLTDSWHRILVLLLTIDAAWDRFFKIYEKLKPVEEFVERRKHERRYEMFNPTTIIKDIELAAQAAQDLQAALPKFAKLITDAKQAYADKGNSAAFATDLETLVTDVSADIQILVSLFPPATPTPPAS